MFHRYSTYSTYHCNCTSSLGTSRYLNCRLVALCSFFQRSVRSIKDLGSGLCVCPSACVLLSKPHIQSFFHSIDARALFPDVSCLVGIFGMPDSSLSRLPPRLAPILSLSCLQFSSELFFLHTFQAHSCLHDVSKTLYNLYIYIFFT